MVDRPFEWMNFRQSEGPSPDGPIQHEARLELADVSGIGLRKFEIAIRLITSVRLPTGQQEAELEVLTRARDALERQIAAIRQST
jgi:hypothetical protein